MYIFMLCSVKKMLVTGYSVDSVNNSTESLYAIWFYAIVVCLCLGSRQANANYVCFYFMGGIGLCFKSWSYLLTVVAADVFLILEAPYR